MKKQKQLDTTSRLIEAPAVCFSNFSPETTPFSAACETPTRLSLQQVDGLGEVGYAYVLGKRRVLTLEGQKHLPGYAPVAKVAGGPGAEFGDILHLSEVH